MNKEELKNRNFESEFVFAASRSSGPGGQNVNKVSTKVELRFNIGITTMFTVEEKNRLLIKLKNKISKEGEHILVSQSERTQLLNKIAVTEKFYELVSKALTKALKRRPTRPTLTSKLKRLDAKRSRGFIKKMRNRSSDKTDL
jgi:ribosome-associated protein